MKKKKKEIINKTFIERYEITNLNLDYSLSEVSIEIF